MTTSALVTAPPGFLWGAATSALQVEGRVDQTNWHDDQRFWRIQQPVGRACNFLESYESDLDLCRAMGLNAFRFSLEWGRIEPEPGRFDAEQIAHYQRIVAACRARGLEPVLTLWHFAYPRWIDRDLRGGWANPGVVDAFGRYARAMSAAMPTVKWWITQNEPNAFALNHCIIGVFPPALGPLKYSAVVDNLVAAHAVAYAELKSGPCERMISANVFHWHPRGTSWPNTADFVARLMPLDYVSFDYYFAHQLWQLPKLATQWEWPVYAAGFEEAIVAYWERFKLPVLVAENGLCTRGSEPRKDGWTRDRYLAHHVHHLLRAVARGANVVGYMHWSLLDNWELGSFEPCFGLYAVDFADPALPRTPGAAVGVYREIVEAGGITAGLAERYSIT